jgi:hypothetical protein
MYWIEGTSPYEAAKPLFNVDVEMAVLVDFLADGKKPGWLRVGADLLAIAGHAQKRLMTHIERIASQTRSDSRSHHLMQAFASTGGYMTFFAWTIPANGQPEAEFKALDAYMVAKKHQVGSDRSYGILVDHRNRIRATIYMNDRAVADQRSTSSQPPWGFSARGRDGDDRRPRQRRSAGPVPSDGEDLAVGAFPFRARADEVGPQAPRSLEQRTHGTQQYVTGPTADGFRAACAGGLRR